MVPKSEPQSSADQPPVDGGGRQVQCYSCSTTVSVGFALTSFTCPVCNTAQVLNRPSKASVPRYGKTAPGPARANRCCPRCKTMFDVPQGVRRFSCPNCDIDTGFHVPRQQAAADGEQEDDEGGMVTETFTDYRPSRLSIGPIHPDPIVETSSLSAVTPPEPTYDLKIKEQLECSKALSCLQIEALVYASQRHLQHLQDGARAGFFIGDGAGVGKGRTIAGLIWENWHHGRTKALWVSVGSDLKFDTRRDLDDVGATCIQVHALNKLPYIKLDSQTVGVRDGVIFLTYSGLIASSANGSSRLEQLVEWCGPGYDGLIIFDECHKAKNLVPEAGKDPTITGETVVEIQKQLPEARVVYCSATGASESRNMAYMVRLGLWGDGTCFKDFSEFSRALEQGGLGALELVAMDMKARGMYLCRTLSYKGAEFEAVEAPLDASMMETYEAATKVWVELREELLKDDKQSAQKWRLYWSIHQLFFRHLCMSAKVPAIVRLAKQALNEGKSVVIGLQSTGEARTEDAVARFGSELDDFISGPRELLLRFVGADCPLPQKPVEVPGKENVNELKRKRNSATPGVPSEGRVPKGAKVKVESEEGSDYKFRGNIDDLDRKENINELKRKRNSATPRVSSEGRVPKVAKVKVESEEESVYKFHGNIDDLDESDDEFQTNGSEKDSRTHMKTEPTEFVDEFQNGTCEICSVEEGMNKMLQCSSCGQLAHPACLVPPVVPARTGIWSCYSCEGKPDDPDFPSPLPRARFLNIESGILENILSLNLPSNPLDDIIDQLGGPDKVAEITGRRGRLVRTSGGEGVTYQARNTADVSKDMVNMHEKKQFMDGNKLVAIISEAGSAGVSLQADRRAANQRRRVHLTLELPWSADRAIQQFGRTHRSNQASAPQYRLLFSNLGGERRFAATVAKRLETLGALTQGDRRAGPSLSAYNYVTFHGKKALRAIYKAILEEGKDNQKATFPVPPPGCSFARPDSIKKFIEEAQKALLSVGIIKDKPKGGRKKSEDSKDPKADSGTQENSENTKDPKAGSDAEESSAYRIKDSDTTNVERFLNRLLGLPPDIQNSLFELFVTTLEHEIQMARFKGTFDKGIIEYKAKLIKLRGTPKNVHVDHTSGAPTLLYTFKVDCGVTWEMASALLAEKQKSGSSSPMDGFYESRNEWGGRRHYLLASEVSTSGMYKIVRPYGEIVTEMSQKDLKGKYMRVGSLKTARTGWEDEYTASSEHCMHGPNCRKAKVCTVGKSVKKVNVLGGVILPIWRIVEKTLSKEKFAPQKRIRIRRVVTTDGTLQVVGLLLPISAVDSLLQELKYVEEIDDD